jgi:2-methylcitrate dehydratase PrpD
MEGPLDHDRSLAEFVASIRFDDLSAQDRSVAKAGILDCLAVMISGSQSRTVRCLMEEVGPWGGVGKAVVVGYGEKLPAVWAGLMNGAAAHADHFDDLNFRMSGHPSCVLVPVLVSLSWRRKVSGRDWLTAYACGFEIGVRLGRAAHPSFYSMGFHATSVLGVVMAASAAACLLELDVAKTLSALGISASLAAGVRANFGSMSQALHIGHATSQGVLAALLAEKGFSSDPEAITGRYGLLDCFAGGQYHCEELNNLGKPFELTRSGINFKFYPSGHPTICAIEAALHLRSAYHITPEMIEEIHCFVGPWIKKSLNKNRPLQKGKEGKVNLPYCLAVALYRGNVVEDDFRDEVLSDPNMTKLRNCCQVHIAEDLPDESEFPARVKIRLSDGRVVEEQRDRSSGSAANSLPRERLIKKFQNQSLPVLGPEATERLMNQLLNLEDIHDITAVTELLQVQ